VTSLGAQNFEREREAQHVPVTVGCVGHLDVTEGAPAAPGHYKREIPAVPRVDDGALRLDALRPNRAAFRPSRCPEERLVRDRQQEGLSQGQALGPDEPYGLDSCPSAGMVLQRLVADHDRRGSAERHAQV
jgi:hypothetical protein